MTTEPAEAVSLTGTALLYPVDAVHGGGRAGYRPGDVGPGAQPHPRATNAILGVLAETGAALTGAIDYATVRLDLPRRVQAMPAREPLDMLGFHVGLTASQWRRLAADLGMPLDEHRRAARHRVRSPLGDVVRFDGAQWSRRGRTEVHSLRLLVRYLPGRCVWHEPGEAEPCGSSDLARVEPAAAMQPARPYCARHDALLDAHVRAIAWDEREGTDPGGPTRAVCLGCRRPIRRAIPREELLVPVERLAPGDVVWFQADPYADTGFRRKLADAEYEHWWSTNYAIVGAGGPTGRAGHPDGPDHYVLYHHNVEHRHAPTSVRFPAGHLLTRVGHVSSRRRLDWVSTWHEPDSAQTCPRPVGMRSEPVFADQHVPDPTTLAD